MQNNKTIQSPPEIHLLITPPWEDYELLDSGAGRKLERFGPHTLIRPESQAIWRPALPEARWRQAQAEFQPGGGETGGKWKVNKDIETDWLMRYKSLSFRAHLSSSRHLGVFPEQASHWDWLQAQIERSGRPVRALNLFGYTGMASLAAAQAGAQVTHVDAARKAILQGQENQRLSGLVDRPIRWLVDDAFKFVRRELRRQTHYDIILLDPPKFGRGPQGQVWEFFDSIPPLLEDCRQLLSPQPVCVVITAYAIRASALSLFHALQAISADLGGQVQCGELVIRESSAGRLLSTAIYARWSAFLEE